MRKPPHQPGDQIGHLTILKQLPIRGHKQGRVYLCRCQCGTEFDATASRLHARYKDGPSCGCVKIKQRTKHGFADRHPLYNTWVGMRRRCRDPKNPDYLHYGGRGIYVDPRWEDFGQFLKDMGEKPGPGYSLDRKNNDGPYSLANCRWATIAEQMRNRGPSLYSFAKWLESNYGVHLEDTILERFLADSMCGQQNPEPTHHHHANREWGTPAYHPADMYILSPPEDGQGEVPLDRANCVSLADNYRQPSENRQALHEEFCSSPIMDEVHCD